MEPLLGLALPLVACPAQRGRWIRWEYREKLREGREVLSSEASALAGAASLPCRWELQEHLLVLAPSVAPVPSEASWREEHLALDLELHPEELCREQLCREQPER